MNDWKKKLIDRWIDKQWTDRQRNKRKLGGADRYLERQTVLRLLSATQIVHQIRHPLNYCLVTS
jgi:hypothetical protein